jgi:hypothetical protein
MSKLLTSIAIMLAAGTLAACGGGLEKAAATQYTNYNAALNDSAYQAPPDYPAGPYGVSLHSTIADLKFVAVDDPISLSDIAGGAAEVHLDQFRTAKTLLITAGAGWCYYCNQEEPAVEQFYKDCNDSSKSVCPKNTDAGKTNFAVLEVLVNDQTLGEPADLSFLTKWARQYSVTFDLGVDPTQVLSAYYNLGGLPAHMLIQTSNMQIAWQNNGEDDQQLESAVNYIINHSN